MNMNMSSVVDLRSDDMKSGHLSQNCLKWLISKPTHLQKHQLYDIDIKEDKVAGGESEAEGGQWCAANPQDQKISRQHLKRILPPTSRSQWRHWKPWEIENNCANFHFVQLGVPATQFAACSATHRAFKCLICENMLKNFGLRVADVFGGGPGDLYSNVGRGALRWMGEYTTACYIASLCRMLPGQMEPS